MRPLLAEEDGAEVTELAATLVDVCRVGEEGEVLGKTGESELAAGGGLDVSIIRLEETALDESCIVLAPIVAVVAGALVAGAGVVDPAFVSTLTFGHNV